MNLIHVGLCSDYILIRKIEKKLIRDVKVHTTAQTCYLYSGSEGREDKHEVEFMKRYKVWKLKEDVTADIIREGVQTKVA